MGTKEEGGNNGGERKGGYSLQTMHVKAASESDSVAWGKKLKEGPLSSMSFVV